MKESEEEDEEQTESVTAMPFRLAFEPEETVSSCLETIGSNSMRFLSSPGCNLEDIAAFGAAYQSTTTFDNQLIICEDTMDSGAIVLDRAVNLECTVTRMGLMAQAFYDPLIIDQTSMQRVLGTFETLVTQLSSISGEATLSELEVISQEDLSQVAQWNKDLPPAVERCMQDLVGERARMNPAHEAVCSAEVSLSYGELEEMSNKLAHYLVDKCGVKKDQIVPFMFEKTPYVVPTLLGIAKSGGAFSPLAPEQPWEDTAWLLENMDATTVVCSAAFAQRFADNGVSTVIIDELAFQRFPDKGPISGRTTPRNRAYVIFTSGCKCWPARLGLCKNSLTHCRSNRKAQRYHL